MPELDPDSTPLSRVDLLRLAQGLGVVDADVMTRAELRAAIDKAQRPEPPALDQHPTTWVSVARRLLASVVERGLNLPDAAALIRGDTKLSAPPKAPPPVATVTLARIYAAQGHLDRAIVTLDEVLESDPDHELARDLRGQLDVRRSELIQRSGAESQRNGVESQRNGVESQRNGVESQRNGVESQRNGAELQRNGVEQPPPSADAPGIPLPGEDNLTRPPPPVTSVDAAAELVAPSFETIERQAVKAESFEAQPLQTQSVEAPSFERRASERPSLDATTTAGELEIPTEPPTLAGVAPPMTEAPSEPSLAGESGPPATLAAGVDWQIENDAASTDVISEANAHAWAATDGANAEAGMEHAEWRGGEGADADATLVLTAAGDATAAAALSDAEASPGAASAADATAIAEGAGDPVLDGATGGAESGAKATVPVAEPFAADAVWADAVAVSEAAPPRAEKSDLESDAARAAERSAESPTLGAENGAHAPSPDAPAAPGSANGIAPASAPSAPGATPAAPPRVPGLLLIETDTPVRYIYWELAAAGGAAPHWIHVVTHTPTGRGDTERRERSFPVHRQLGALRLEGVPRQAVVRARLTHAPGDARPLVVAGAVRPRSLAGDDSFEVRYAPHAKAAPEALVGRARLLLERASPVYWDS